MAPNLITPKANTPEPITPQAIIWIRDGVLVNRMHVNPVAFAMTYWLFTKAANRKGFVLEELINFGFAKSGVSCSEKITLFSAEYGHSTEEFCNNIKQASAFYNELATAMALSCTYFDGAVDLVKQLHDQGVFNFITSAVEQHVLDSWAQTEAGLELSPYLTEILGKRPGFVKGRDHFSHVAARLDGGVIYCVADAPAEISMATELSRDFNIVPIGFAYGVHKHDVMQAVALAEQLVTSPSAAWVVPPPCGLAGGQVDVSERLINLPDSIQVVASLEASGARFVVAGSAQSIMSELGSLLLG